MAVRREEEREVPFLELILLLKRNFIEIFLATLVAAVIGWAVSSFLIKPQYEASIHMIVNVRSENSQTVTNDNLSAAKNLINIYDVIIKGNTVLTPVIRTLGLDMSFEELYELVSVTSVNDTPVMKITARHENPETAKTIVETIAAIAPSIVTDAVEAGSCKVVTQADVSGEPVFPDVLECTVIAGLLGMLLYMSGAVLKEFI